MITQSPRSILPLFRTAGAVAAATLAAIWLVTSPASAAYVTVYGGPTYNAATQTGYQSPLLPVAPGWTAGDGVAVGAAHKYSGGMDLGYRAVRWDASGAAATELGNLGTDSSGYTGSGAVAINSAGVAIGGANKYNGDTSLGGRAVRWDASGTAATELGNLGTNGSGYTIAGASAINSGGTAVGYAYTYIGDTYLGPRAVRWDASGTAATELGNLGTNSSGETDIKAYAVNTAGVAVGFANKFTGGTYLGNRAVRWDASGTALTELGNLGTNSSGGTDSGAVAINSAGTAVGYAIKYSPDGTSLGTRAVRWDANGTAATELGSLGNDINGITGREAYAINSAGIAVGFANKFTGDTYVDPRAVLWDLDAVAVDLNTLIDPASGWTLTEARGISDTNWVTGLGSFDPDGAGPFAAYDRAFLIDVNSLLDSLPGDYNGDGTVDAADYIVWRKTNGTQTGYAAWRSHFGLSLSSGSGAAGYPLGASAEPLSAAVPELSSFALLTLAAPALLRRRRFCASRQFLHPIEGA
jgi:hypothetical protein